MSNSDVLTQTDGEPKNWLEQLAPPQVVIVEDEHRGAQRAWTDGTAHLERMDDYGVKIAECVLGEYDAQKNGANEATLEKLAKRTAAAKKRRDEYKAKRDAEMATRTGDKYQICVDRRSRRLIEWQ